MTPATCYPIDTTPGDTFGIVGCTDGLIEYREEEIPRLLEELRPVPHRWEHFRQALIHHTVAHGGR